VSKINVERYEHLGYVFAKKRDYEGVHDKLVGEESELDSRITRRELVLMEIPEELALQRDAHYANLAERAEKSTKKKFQKDVDQTGATAYDPSVRS